MTDARARWTKVDCEPLAPIELARRPDRRAFRWGTMLVALMRIVAVLWVFHSLLNWCVILGVGPTTDFAKLGRHGFAATVFFAVVDPVAAVGLWLATPWGGVTWLFAVAAQLFVIVLLPSLFANGPLLMATNSALVVCYFILTFAASRERETV
jgi:uncharacterized membrane protein